MPFVSDLEIANDSFASPEWPAVVDAFGDLERPEYRNYAITLSGGDDAFMIITFEKRYGYYVTARTDADELGEHVLVDTDLGDEIVEVLICGQPDKWPRYFFVAKKRALEAARFFFESGERTAREEWQRPYDVEMRQFAKRNP